MKNRHTDRREPLLGPTRPRSPAEVLEPARAPSRPAGGRGSPRKGEWRRVNALARVVSGLLTISLVTMAGLGGLGLLLYSHLERPGPLEVSRTLNIKGGGYQVAEQLEREGVIAWRYPFIVNYLIGRWRGATDELKAGEYEFKKHASMREVLETISQGKSLLTRLTIPEGLTSLQIVERLRAEDDLTGDIAAIPPEGTLLPDTYSFSKGMARQELLDRMKDEQQRLIAKIWEKRQPELPVETSGDAIILASIVEKETGRADERERVAAVFVNRLRKRMRLESDPTFVYGIAPGQGSLGRAITQSDIDTKTPYNTYQIQGLPPTPICNPGRAAIEATLNPAKTTDLFFVANGTGGHTFSPNYEQHKAAVAVWRKVERETRAKQAQEPAAATKDKAAAKAAVIPVPGVVKTVDGDDGPEPEAAPAAAAAPAKGAKTSPPAKAAAVVNVPLPVKKPKR